MALEWLLYLLQALGGHFGFHDTALDLLFSGAKPRSVDTDLASFERHLVPYFATDSVAEISAKKPSKTATKRYAVQAAFQSAGVQKYLMPRCPLFCGVQIVYLSTVCGNAGLPSQILGLPCPSCSVSWHQ